MIESLSYKFLEPTEYILIEHFFDRENVPRLDPDFSRVAAAINSKGEVVGVICLQLVAHAEPIIIEPEYRETGVWQVLAKMMDEYCLAMKVPGLYTQPTSQKTEHMAEKMNFSKCDYPLYLKVYLPQYASLIVTENLSEGEPEWPQQSQQQLEPVAA